MKTAEELLAGIDLPDLDKSPEPQAEASSGGRGRGSLTTVGADFNGDDGHKPPLRPTAIDPESQEFKDAAAFERFWKTPIDPDAYQRLRKNNKPFSTPDKDAEAMCGAMLRGYYDEGWNPQMEERIPSWIGPHLESFEQIRRTVQSTSAFREFLLITTYLGFANGQAPTDIYPTRNFGVLTRIGRLGLFAPEASRLVYEKHALDWHTQMLNPQANRPLGFMAHDPEDFNARFRDGIVTRYGNKV